jgi:hypothetical protein
MGMSLYGDVDAGSNQSLPSRDSVRQWWSRLVDGAVNRCDAHLWAAQWVEGNSPEPVDSMVLTALQYLHGYDMIRDISSGMIIHSTPECQGQFVKPDSEIRADLERWIANCRIYDIDPNRYRATMKRKALETIMDEAAKGEK